MSLQIVKLDLRPSIGSVLMKDPEYGQQYLVEMQREPYYLLRARDSTVNETLEVGDILYKISSSVISEDFCSDVDEIYAGSNVEFKILEK